MAIKTYKPTSATLRGTVIVVQDGLEKSKEGLSKKMYRGLNKTSGRNNHGRITNRNRAGRVKRNYLFIDFKRQHSRDVLGVVEAVYYDPNRTANVALIKKKNGHKYLILGFSGITKGQLIDETAHADIKPGNHLKLKDIPAGTVIHNVELTPGGGGKVARTAGGGCQILGREGKFILLRMPSSEVRRFDENCYATIGNVGNEEHENRKIGSAGRHRKMGRKPHVRGVAMNPIDHPLGGGEGKSSGGRHPCSPWGQLAKGLKTRYNKRTNKFIVSRRKGKKV